MIDWDLDEEALGEDDDTPEMVMMSQEDYNEMSLDAEMDRNAAMIVLEYAEGSRETACICEACIVKRWAEDHGGIQ